MPKRASLSNGAWLETQLHDGSNEIFATGTNAAGVSQKIEVAWRWSGRSADITVTNDIVQGQTAVSYGGGGSQWKEPFSKVQYGTNRHAAKPLVIGNDSVQVVFDCATVAVFDIWTNSWVHASPGVQLTLQVT